MKKLLRLISVATMLLAATTFMACSSDDDDGPSESSSATRVGSGAFVGVVLDNTGKPVEGATVTLGTKTATTNKGGEFELKGVPVNNPVVKSVQTGIVSGTIKNGDENVGATAGTTSTEATKCAYTLTVTKDGYLPGTVGSMYVSEAEDIGGIEDARLSALKNEYAGILNAYAGAVGTANVAKNSSGEIVGFTGESLEDKSATMKTVADALKEIQNLYAHLGKTYSSTFVECKTLVPLNASLSGKLKLNPSPATAEVFNETTYPAPKDTVVTVTYTAAKDAAPYTFKSKTDAEGNFKFEKLPSGVDLSIKVEGFTAKAGEVEAYFSTDGGLNAYRANFEEILNNGEYYNDGTNATKNSIKIDGNSLNVAGVDIMLFAQLEKIWVKETNLIKNNSAALISVKTPLEFTFNKAIQRVDLAGSGFQDVKDENYVVTIDSTDAKKVTITPKDGIWSPKAGTNDKPPAGAVKLSVLAADGTKELVNSEFTAYFDETIYIAITESSEKDKLLSLTDPVVLTFSKPMRTATVTARDGLTATSDEVTSDYTKVWSEDKTTLTLTPKKYWSPVASAAAEVVFTVTGVAEDETSTVKYWKTNSDNGTKYTGLKVYFDNVIDVTLAKVNDAKFTATFSKALKEIPALDLSSYFTIKYYAPGSNTAVVVNDAKLSFADKVLTVEAKTGEFEHYGYYEVTVATTVVGATGESKFRETGKTATATAFKADFTLGAEFKETDVEVVSTLPATAVASRAVYADAASYVKITFTKDIAKSNLKVTDQTVTNYIDGKSVYLPLAKNADEDEVKITGTVTAKIGDTKEWGTTATPAVLTPGLKVSKNIFKMVESSLYKKVESIAGGKNDAVVNEIKPTDSITFTFDQDVTGAEWTAELYDSLNVGSKDLNKTVYKVDVTKEGKVVTVKLAEGSKPLVNGDTYYLSLKAVAGKEKIVVYDSSTFKATGDGSATEPKDKYYAYLPGKDTTLGAEFVKTPVTGSTKSYIEIVVESETAKYKDIYVVDAGKKNSKTTAFKDFAKGIKNPIVLEFAGVDNITGFTAVLATSDKSDVWDKAEKVELKDTYASEAKIEGNVLTITPTAAYPHGKTIYPMVFNAEGGLVALNDVKGNALIGNTTTKQYVSNDLTDTKILDAATANADTSALKLTQINTADTANGKNIEFSFEKQIGAYKATYGKYTLYKKIVPAVESAAKWERAATYAVKDDNNAWVDSSSATATNPVTTEIKLIEGSKASSTDAKFNDFRILKKNGALVISAGTDFTYSNTILYRLVFENDNLAIWSDVIAVKENAVLFTNNGKGTLNLSHLTNNEAKQIVDGATQPIEITLSATMYIDPATLTYSVGKGASTPAEDDHRVTKPGKLTAKVDGKDIKITIAADATACKGDSYTVEGKDTNAQPFSKTVIFE